MSKKLALIAGLAAVTASGAALAGAPVVYGKANVSYQFDDNGADDDNTAWVVKSNASRLGVKGKHKLGGGLQAFYKAEYQIEIDSGSGPFKTRNIYAGLKGSAGELKVGRFDTIVKKAQGKVDLFNDLFLGDIGKQGITGDERGDNTLQYTSPELAKGLKLKAAIFTGEDASGDKGPADAIQVGAEYKAGALWASLAIGIDSGDDVIAEESQIVRAAVQYKMDSVTLGALVNSYDDGTDAELGFVASAAFKAGEKNTVKVQYTSADAADENTINLGFDHKINKKVKTFAYVGVESEDENKTLGAGLEVKF